MPGLIRGMARTAAIVGTAEATRKAVDRHQASKEMQAYGVAPAAAAAPPPPPAQGYYAAPPPPPQYAPPPDAAPAAPPQDDLAAQLQRLANLHQQGILTDDEYSAAKQKLLTS